MVTINKVMVTMDKMTQWTVLVVLVQIPMTVLVLLLLKNVSMNVKMEPLLVVLLLLLKNV
jgi:hypothetical protein